MKLYSLASTGGRGAFYLFNEGQERDLCRICGWNQMSVTGIARAEPVDGSGNDPIVDDVVVFGGQMLASSEVATDMIEEFSNILLGPVHCTRPLRGRGTSNADIRHVYVKECFRLNLDGLPEQFLIQCKVCGRQSYNTREARAAGIQLPVACKEGVGLARVCFEYPMLLATEAMRSFMEQRNLGQHLIWRDYGITVS